MKKKTEESPAAGRNSTSCDVIVVGAGFAGLYMLHRLREAGLSAIGIEAGKDVGGTWYWNRYPGARCDVHSLEYSYSFSKDLQQEWHWSERFAPQPEILRYIQHVADRFDLRRDIRFNSRVVSATFDDAATRWTVETDKGERFSAAFCVMATGSLSSARIPPIEGLETFKGEIYHTGEWPHEPVDFTGKRVGVIGTGSSGIQTIPSVAQYAESLHVFQRTPHYTIPARNQVFPQEYVVNWKENYPSLRAKARTTRVGVLHEFGTKTLQETSPEETRQELERRWIKGGNNFMYAYTDVIADPASNKVVADFVRQKISETVKDPETARKLMPTDFPIGTKRVCLDTDYYATFNRENVTLVDLRAEPIREITPQGIATERTTYPLDALIFATGFDAFTGSLLAMDIRTTSGAALRDSWHGGPRTYLGFSVAGFPNMFLITGPGSPSVFSNMVLSIEHDVEWIAACLTYARDHGIDRIEADAKAQEDWVGEVNKAVEGTLFEQANSWYIGANVPGKPRVFMPYIGGVDVFQRICREVAEQGYRGFTLRAREAATSG